MNIAILTAILQYWGEQNVRFDCKEIQFSKKAFNYIVKYKMNVIPNKECILIIHKLELNCIFRIKSDSSSAEFARYGVMFTSAIRLFNSKPLIRNYIHFIFTEIISRKRILQH